MTQHKIPEAPYTVQIKFSRELWLVIQHTFITTQSLLDFLVYLELRFGKCEHEWIEDNILRITSNVPLGQLVNRELLGDLLFP